MSRWMEDGKEVSGTKEQYAAHLGFEPKNGRWVEMPAKAPAKRKAAKR